MEKKIEEESILFRASDKIIFIAIGKILEYAVLTICFWFGWYVMHVTQLDRLSSSVDITNFVDALFSAFRTSNTLMIPIRLPVKICNAE